MSCVPDRERRRLKNSRTIAAMLGRQALDGPSAEISSRWVMFQTLPSLRWTMSTSNDISTLCNEFTNALTEVLAENAVGPARRGRLARARAAVKKHPEYSEHAYFLAVETAFTQWEAMQNVCR